THGTQKSQKHTYRPGQYAWSVTVTVRRQERTVSLTEPGTIVVTQAGIKVLRVKSYKVNKRAKSVTPKLRSQIDGEVDIYLKAGRQETKVVRKTLAKNRDMAVTLPTRGLGIARNATLVVRFRAVPAG